MAPSNATAPKAAAPTPARRLKRTAASAMAVAYAPIEAQTIRRQSPQIAWRPPSTTVMRGFGVDPTHASRWRPLARRSKKRTDAAPSKSTAPAAKGLIT